MNEQQQALLAQLKDIHKASPDSWPPGWGWWLVAVLAAVLVTAALIAWRRHRRHTAARRQAITAINTVSDSHNDWPSQINQILKRTALAYFPRHSMSGLYGQRWTQFMLAQLKRRQQQNLEADLQCLQDMLYQPAHPDPDQFERCRKAALLWLKKARIGTFSTPAGASHV